MSNNFINTAGVFKGFDGFICSSAMIHIFKMCIFSWPAPNMTLFLTCPILTVFKVIMTTPSHCTRDNFILCTFRLECSCRDAESTSYHYQDGTLCVYIYIYTYHHKFTQWWNPRETRKISKTKKYNYWKYTRHNPKLCGHMFISDAYCKHTGNHYDTFGHLW